MTTFLAADRSVAVEIEEPALETIVAIASQSQRLETGGVLLGRYGEFRDRVIVSEVTGPPRDSRRFPIAFIRGVAGLTRRLRRAWRDDMYYVGEWHLHPKASPNPSETDRAQILEFSNEADYRCPHPVLVVIGGRPPDSYALSCAVVIDGRVEPLEEQRPY